MEILAAEQVVHGSFRVLIIIVGEPPARPALCVTFRIRPHDGKINDVSKSFDMSCKVRSMGEGAEEAYAYC